MKAARLCGCVQNSRPKWCAHQEAPSQSSGYNSNDTRNRIALNVGGNLGTAASKLQHGEAQSEYAWAASRCPHIPAGSQPNGRRGRARRGLQASQGTHSPSELAGRVRATQSNGKDGESDDETADRAMQMGRTRKGLDSLPSRQRVRRVQGVLRSCHPAT